MIWSVWLLSCPTSGEALGVRRGKFGFPVLSFHKRAVGGNSLFRQAAQEFDGGGSRLGLL
jgi:hypothetical protein